MDLEKIKNSNTMYLGKEIIYKKEIESTQSLAKELAKQNIKNGTIIITDYQTKGKGTKGRSWSSQKEKNITMTILINKQIEISKLESFTIRIAEAIKEAIYELHNYRLTIKKPNDIFLNNKKICGILTETSIINSKVNYLIIGIGFNINEEIFSKELENIATSLKKEFKIEFEREEIIIKILEKLELMIENQFI